MHIIYIYICIHDCLFHSIYRSWQVDRGVPIPLSFRDIGTLTFDHFTWWESDFRQLMLKWMMSMLLMWIGALHVSCYFCPVCRCFIERIMCNDRLAVTQHYSSIHQDISQRHTGGALGSFVLGNLIGLNLEFFGHELHHPGSHRGNFGKFQVQHWNLENHLWKFAVWYKSIMNSICCLYHNQCVQLLLKQSTTIYSDTAVWFHSLSPF